MKRKVAINEILHYHDAVDAVAREKGCPLGCETIPLALAANLSFMMNRVNLYVLASDEESSRSIIALIDRYLKATGYQDSMKVERHRRWDGDQIFYYADAEGNPTMFSFQLTRYEGERRP